MSVTFPLFVVEVLRSCDNEFLGDRTTFLQETNEKLHKRKSISHGDIYHQMEMIAVTMFIL